MRRTPSEASFPGIGEHITSFVGTHGHRLLDIAGGATEAAISRTSALLLAAEMATTGRVRDALVVCETAGLAVPMTTLFAWGERALVEKRPWDAVVAFDESGDRARLLECAERCLEQDAIDDALVAYELAGTQPHAGLVTMAAYRCLESGATDDALTGFRAAGHAPAEAQLLAVGDQLLGEGRFEAALLLFLEVGATRGIAECGRLFLIAGELRAGRSAYERAAKAPPPLELVACAHVCLERGWIADALGAFQEARAPLPSAEVQAAGDACLASGAIDAARVAFAVLQDTDGLRRCAEAYLRTGEYARAVEICEATGITQPLEAHARSVLDDGDAAGGVAAFAEAIRIALAEQHRAAVPLLPSI